MITIRPSQERGHVQIAIATPNGPEPLVNHVSAACRRFISRNILIVMDVTLVIHQSAGWETTMWDHANAVVGSWVSLLSVCSFILLTSLPRRAVP